MPYYHSNRLIVKKSYAEYQHYQFLINLIAVHDPLCHTESCGFYCHL